MSRADAGDHVVEPIDSLWDADVHCVAKTQLPVDAHARAYTHTRHHATTHTQKYSLSDYRVGYYEAAKWVARIRAGVAAAKAGALEGAVNEPLLIFETNMAAGHAGASGRFDRLKEVSRDVAFLATEFDVQDVRGKLYLDK